MIQTMNTNRHTIAVAKVNGNSNIPLRRTLSRNSSTGSNSSKIPLSESQAHRWKQKFEESEEKRRSLLSEKEKALRSLNDVEKKYLNLQVKHEHLETELFEKNEEFTKLSAASKSLYKEYETLKNQYETETGAMSRALKDASQWYKENKALKRKTLLLVDKDTVDEGVDTGENSNDADLENLNKTIKQLSTEVAELQTELDSLRQTEFQTSEQNIKLSEELEEERKKNITLEARLNDVMKENQQILRITEMMKKELEELKELKESQRNDVVQLRREADNAKKERNVLAHQSTLLLQGLNDNNGNEIVLLEEIENLKRALEDERIKHEEELNSLQERFEDQDSNSQVEILEERLKIVESELQEALKRAEEAEEKLKAPPAPPPPPPPPLMPLAPPDNPPVVPLRRRRSRATVQEIAETIGIQENNNTPEKKPPAPGVNEDIINAIKEGKFTLKKAKSDKEKKEKETPKAVSEILNILGSLRRAPKKRQSQFFGDVEL